MGRGWVIALVMTGLALGAAGCTAVGAAAGAGATAGLAAMDERGFEGVVADKATEVKITKAVYDYDPDVFVSIAVTVHEGRALLVGEVREQAQMDKVVEIAWKTDGVDRVINEIEVSTDESLLDYGHDVVIANNLRSRLIFDEQVDSVNYTVDVVNGSVYIMGIARNPEEKTRVVGHAKQIAYVRRVVEFIRLKTPENNQDGSTQ